MGAIWDGGGEPEASHFLITLCFSLGFAAARFLLDNLVYKRLAFIFLNKSAVSMVIDEVSQSKIVKSSESMWKFTYYFTVQIWVLLIMKQEPWSMDILQYFNGWPNQDLKFSLKLFYMCECGFYVYSIAALLTWETRRKDFSIMMSHHIITSILIGYSYLTGFFRIGTIILALHDTSDVFLEAAKVCKYSGKEMCASLFFGLFAVSWLLLRLIIFPFFIIKASSYHSIDAFKMGTYPTVSYYAFNTMLLMLLVFHMYWWKLICAMIMRQLNNQGKVGEDIREDSGDRD